MKVEKLRGVMAERGYSAEKLAKEAEMNVDTLRRKLRSGKFGVNEAKTIASILKIENPLDIFFAD